MISASNFLPKQVLLILVTLIISTGLLANGIEDSKVFKDMTLTTAKELAVKEGKMIFVDFYASWCTPCKWMDQTTFNDQSVIDYIGEHYIAVRVDIDDFDGYVLRNVYNVKVLPTFLILDENGMTKHRKEETLNAQALLDLLQNKKSSDKTAKLNSSPFKNKTEEAVVKLDTGSEPGMTANQNNRATVEPTTTYRVQVGVFADYANTQKMVDQMSDLSGEPIVVLNDHLNGKTIFKVMLGEFDNRESASIFKNQLHKNYGIEGIVK
ncbi:MAG TPA: thioredoxin family protein [Saprospiraceae bacterium]|nr:hypothetical protein [Saprospirales bacterium]HRQ30932.1 thioredoxin family protein [Saprospiraceae bacterium]